jgi:hypothetical protein
MITDMIIVSIDMSKDDSQYRYSDEKDIHTHTHIYIYIYIQAHTYSPFLAFPLCARLSTFASRLKSALREACVRRVVCVRSDLTSARRSDRTSFCFWFSMELWVCSVLCVVCSDVVHCRSLWYTFSKCMATDALYLYLSLMHTRSLTPHVHKHRHRHPLSLLHTHIYSVSLLSLNSHTHTHTYIKCTLPLPPPPLRPNTARHPPKGLHALLGRAAPACICVCVWLHVCVCEYVHVCAYVHVCM